MAAVAAPQVSLRTLALTGDAAPGAPAGVEFDFITAGIINDAGQVVFRPVPRPGDRVERLPAEHVLYVCNHVSLLDTIFLGVTLDRLGRLPVLVMGDLATWKANWLRRTLCARIGYLIDRDRISREVVEQLRAFGRSHEGFELLVFPEGTRGDGVTVQECQRGVATVAREARVPIVPVFMEGMQHLSTKTARATPIRGLGRVTFHFGEPWRPDDYLRLSPAALCDEMRERIQSLATRR